MALQLDARATTDDALLFVDFSNLWYAVRAEATRRGDAESAIRIHAGHLQRMMAAGRPIADSVLVANSEVPEAVLTHFRPFFRVVLVEAGRVTGTEQAGDEMLQNAMYSRILSIPAPGTVVLASGDGAGWREGRGFCATLLGARRLGFGVEVLAFQASLNRTLRTLGDVVGATIYLDSYYRSITFLEGLRAAQPPSLIRRPSAGPRPWSAIEHAAVLSLTDGLVA